MRNLIYVLCSLALIGVGVGMMRGDVQEVIHFADPLNELVFTMLVFLLSVAVLSNLKLKSK
jgi:hypothetical protein